MAVGKKCCAGAKKCHAVAGRKAPQYTPVGLRFAAAGASIFAAAPMVANAGTMGQELVKDPTEVYVQLYLKQNYLRIF